ncbi:hypothetical protein ACQ4LE_009757 [Meloidogyne hapla]
MFQKHILLLLLLTTFIIYLSTFVNGACIQMCQGSSCSQICKKKRDVDKWIDMWGKFNGRRRKRTLESSATLCRDGICKSASATWG